MRACFGSVLGHAGPENLDREMTTKSKSRGILVNGVAEGKDRKTPGIDTSGQVPGTCSDIDTV